MDADAGRSDRRKTDRRKRSRGTRSGESWFGAFIGDADTHAYDDSRLDEVQVGDDGRSSASADVDSRFLSREGEPGVPAGQSAFDRIYRAFLSARAALGMALIATVAAAGVLGALPGRAVVWISLAYAALSVGMWLSPISGAEDEHASVPRLSRLHWTAGIGADILCFIALHVLSQASGLNYAALLVLPVLMAGVLTRRLQALATAAAVALLLLGNAWVGVIAGGDPAALMTQAGLAGSGLFVITVLAGELASRLAREELTAKDSMELARQQAQLNRLVIEEMQDGVLVVDRAGRVRAANPAARRLLVRRGLGRPAPFQLRGVVAWDQLVKTVERGFHEAVWPEAGRDVMLQFEQGTTRTLRVRIRFTRRADEPSAEELCVLLLEDVRSMQARMRQEKLAAMGRVSAGIAHEIRNPLAAIAQANALLSEDAVTADQHQLTRMVADNVKRLKRIVDDVMEVTPGTVIEATVIDANAEVAAACSDWAQAASLGLGDSSVLKVDLPDEPLGVVFDGEHLRRVLINLLDNARRHATDTPGSVHVRLLALDESTAQLSVSSDGSTIPVDVERYLFEPFFSTRSRGTGLGLYICRQLCEQYGASIDYRMRSAAEPNRNDFFVNMLRRDWVNSETRLQFPI
ncbi:MAG: ATP-binding protein [Pseudomonadota bacterium]|nr:ATP-binding protein [Pseudomonadota bacterium]